MRTPLASVAEHLTCRITPDGVLLNVFGRISSRSMVYHTIRLRKRHITLQKATNERLSLIVARV